MGEPLEKGTGEFECLGNGLPSGMVDIPVRRVAVANHRPTISEIFGILESWRDRVPAGMSNVPGQAVPRHARKAVGERRCTLESRRYRRVSSFIDVPPNLADLHWGEPLREVSSVTKPLFGDDFAAGISESVFAGGQCRRRRRVFRNYAEIGTGAFFRNAIVGARTLNDNAGHPVMESIPVEESRGDREVSRVNDVADSPAHINFGEAFYKGPDVSFWVGLKARWDSKFTSRINVSPPIIAL